MGITPEVNDNVLPINRFSFFNLTNKSMLPNNVESPAKKLKNIALFKISPYNYIKKCVRMFSHITAVRTFFFFKALT